MKRFFSIFFLFVMTANVAVSFVEQLYGGDVYEMSKGNADDADEKEKGEKEKDEKERKSDSLVNLAGNGAGAFRLKVSKGLLNLKSNYLISEYHGQQPELPPEV